MMKNNRPFSNENGWIDDSLITDRPQDEMTTALGWINENIRPARRKLEGRTSYGIKHILQHDTGLYLTNNEFKDAMLLSGYAPIDANELNWHYRISGKSPAFVREENW